MANTAAKPRYHVYAPAPFPHLWINQLLLKDCGIAPYMFHKVFGYDVTMLGVRNGDYPYLDLMPGLEMEFLPDCETDQELLECQISFLERHFSDMDILVLNGPYWLYQHLLPQFRKLRPDGKVYLALDANAAWMDRIIWTDPMFVGLLDSCDVIATSCRKMQQHLNRKWGRWEIEYIPNGFFNPTELEISPTPDQKENIILTVGRIGNAAKANQLLLEAFAQVYTVLPGWNVHLVGGIEPGFNAYIDSYFNRYPQLRNRVFFKGLIESKVELYQEYARAKVFALTSISEGGVPNVIAEALFHGCYVITSDIDAATDITDNETIGRIFPMGSSEALMQMLLEVCGNETLLEKSLQNIVTYAKNTFDWELLIKRIHHLLLGGE